MSDKSDPSDSPDLAPTLNLQVPATSTEVTEQQPLDPAWDAVRELAGQLRSMGRLFLRGQVRLGMMLAALKKEHGHFHGGDRKSSARIPHLIPWADTVKRETGYSRQSADEFIRLFEATKAKLAKGKKLDLPAPAKKDALVLFHAENPLALTDDQWELVSDVIASLTCGETQASLMVELGILPKPKAMPKGGGGKPDDLDAGQMAFHFFDAAMAGLFNARTSPDYKKLLYVLPPYSNEENKISLDLIASECRAVLKDIEEVQQAIAKPAQGRVI